VNRLEIYTQVTLEGAVIELIVEMMVQLLHVLGLVTKAIEQKYWSKYDLDRCDAQLKTTQPKSERSFWERTISK
jgi:hypothetical protein